MRKNERRAILLMLEWGQTRCLHRRMPAKKLCWSMILRFRRKCGGFGKHSVGVMVVFWLMARRIYDGMKISFAMGT